MSISATKLRANVYEILDQVLETGVPVEIERRGKKVLLVPAKRPSKTANLKRRSYLRVDPEALVHLDWSAEWRP